MRPPAKFFLPFLLAPALWAGAAHATVQTCSLSSLAGNPNACNYTLGGIVFSGFSISNYTPNVGANDQFELVYGEGANVGDGEVRLNFDPDRNNSVSPAASFSYTITLPSFRAFQMGEVNLDARNGPNPPTPNATTTFSSSGLPAITSSGGSVTADFQPNLTTQTFTQTFAFVSNDGSDQLRFVRGGWTTYQTVPGPLPLLGAATAFGLSRKLRSRIRSAG